MKRQLSLSVMEDDLGYVTVMLMLHQTCNDDFTHEAVEVLQTDACPPNDNVGWIQFAYEVIAAALNEPGQAGQNLLKTMKEGRDGCVVRH